MGQVRAQCAHDVRRRDAEIRRLQKHLEPRRGGGGGGGCGGGGGRESAAPVGVTVVHPAAAPRKSQAASVGAGAGGGAAEAHGSGVESPEYSLRDETTEFLTQLSTELSDENDALVALARRTIATLSSLQGLPPPDPAAAAVDGSLVSAHSDPNVASTAPPATTVLAAQTSSLLAHLQELLTDPGFVRVEEVHARDAELARLRAGWDRIEARWREAVGLMRGWRAQLAAGGGDTLRWEDLGAGLELGEGEVRRVAREKERMGSSPPRPEDVVGRPRGRTSSGSAEGSGVDSSMVSVELPRSAESSDVGSVGGTGDGSAPTKKPSAPPRRASPPALDVDLGIALLPTPAVLRPVAGNLRRGSPRAARQAVARVESHETGGLPGMLGSDDDAGLDDVALLDAASESSQVRHSASAHDTPRTVLRK